jgi:hypothetical protein
MSPSELARLTIYTCERRWRGCRLREIGKKWERRQWQRHCNIGGERGLLVLLTHDGNGGDPWVLWGARWEYDLVPEAAAVCDVVSGCWYCPEGTCTCAVKLSDARYQQCHSRMKTLSRFDFYRLHLRMHQKLRRYEICHRIR